MTFQWNVSILPLLVLTPSLTPKVLVKRIGEFVYQTVSHGRVKLSHN